jgi:hypothetical protein
MNTGISVRCAYLSLVIVHSPEGFSVYCPYQRCLKINPIALTG